MILLYFRWVTFHQKSGSKFVKNNRYQIYYNKRRRLDAVIVVKMQIKKRQTHLQTYLQNTLSKLLIIPLLSKNENRDTLVFTSRQESNIRDNFSSKNHIITTQKQTKKRQIHPQTP